MLPDLQRDFARTLLTGSGEGASHIVADKLSAEARLAIYRHNVFTNLTHALADIFPVVARIVGEAFFREAARLFIRDVPSTSGDLNRYGAAFGDFLQAYPHAQELPYLADVARLEWAWHQAFHAADGGTLDLARLAAVPAEGHGALRLRLHPGARLLRSPFPLLAIWQVNQPGYEGELAIDWQAGTEYLLVYRPDTEVIIRKVPAAAWRFYAACEQGMPLEAAMEAASANESEFDLQGLLLESVQSAIIVDFLGE
ncbi:MAG: putative DNA-binding domain-containing protein [Betaproteobacteria bacterium]|nr:putative DNA-binding domain-containing protein [Betaproteobacteria bacterium]